MWTPGPAWGWPRFSFPHWSWPLWYWERITTCIEGRAPSATMVGRSPAVEATVRQPSMTFEVVEWPCG